MGKGVILQWWVSTATVVVLKLPSMYEIDLGSTWKHLQTTYVSQGVISAHVVSQGAHKIPGLEYPLNRGKEIIWYNERHLLLLKCFISFLKYISKVWGAFARTYKPHIVHTYHICWGQLSNCMRVKLLDLGQNLHKEKGVLYYKERYGIHWHWTIQ